MTLTTSLPPVHDNTGRAVHPSERGLAERPDGVRIALETFGSRKPTLVLLPSAPIVHSRQWKGQEPYLSRHFRVVTFDGRGNGGSDRPFAPEAYSDAEIVGDVEAVMDATGTDAAVLVGLCGNGVWRAIEGSVDAMLADADVEDDWNLSSVEATGRAVPVLANLLIRDFVRSIGRTES